MDNYFEDNDYIVNTKTKSSDSEKTINNPKNMDIKIDYNYYTIRKSTKKIIGYVEKQN